MKELKEIRTADIMAEGQQLHDQIYNLGLETQENIDRMESIYAEMEDRGVSVMEGYSVQFIEHTASKN